MRTALTAAVLAAFMAGFTVGWIWSTHRIMSKPMFKPVVIERTYV